jgi:hypothetical protein
MGPTELTNIFAAWASAKIDGVLPGGGSSYNYPDTNKVWHTFTVAQWIPLAEALRDYYYNLTQVSNGGSVPSSTITIA